MNVMELAWKIYKDTGTYTFQQALKQAHESLKEFNKWLIKSENLYVRNVINNLK